MLSFSRASISFCSVSSYKLTELRPEHFRKFYADMRKERNQATGKPLSESTVEGLLTTFRWMWIVWFW